MAAGIYNFTLEQGTTFIRIFNYKDSNGNPINLNEATELRMQIRESVGIRKSSCRWFFWIK